MATRKFQRREWAVLVIGLLMVVLIGSKPIGRFMREHKNSANQVRQAQNNLRQARELRMMVETERGGQEALRSVVRGRNPLFDLYSFTNDCLTDLDLKSRATLSSTGRVSTPGADAVDLTLKGLSMDEFRSLLHRIYSSNNLIVLRHLQSLRPAADGKGLDVMVGFISPES